ncbi:unnamed protein product [Moneuplotes crassus]|uniref:cysteine desulfurase n=1 Tax=Euplotes crassus TaxID=5936 RepID=A0AAD1UQ00_EUPCR|nr:unnamed protein product [Moneuplotes crassus]
MNLLRYRTLIKSCSSLVKMSRRFCSTIDYEAKPIFLDNQATTPIDPRVFDEMVPHMTRDFGNPHSTAHIYGTKQMKVCDKARERVADCISTCPSNIIFLSGATEANNTAIKGVSRALKSSRNEIITFETEHKCVLESFYDLEKEGMKIKILPVEPTGLINLDLLKEAISDKTLLVTAMAVNNEIGVIHSLKEIGALCKEHGAYFHTDAAQGIGKARINVTDMNIDMLSLTGHKFYGPKGIGALYISQELQGKLKPLMSGGGQEKGIRSGTLTPFLLSGLGKACQLATSEFDRDKEWVSSLQSYFFKTLSDKVEGIHLNGDPDHRYQGNLNIAIEGVYSSRLISDCTQVAMSSGAACLNDDLLDECDLGAPSYVLSALQIPKTLALSSVRFSFGRFTTKEEVEAALGYLQKSIIKLRNQ